MEKSFKKIGIIYNPEIKDAKNTALQINERIKNSLTSSIDNPDFNIDLAMVIGGDGSFLKIARTFCQRQIPILGFNLGRLGYLAQAGVHEIDSVIKKLENREYKIENRLMIKSGKNTALNDIVVKGLSCNRTAALDLYINNKLLCSYVADGLIVSTPTGSTAYSLSAGGPIIAPELECLLVIPICPHTLNTRPVIVPKNEKIMIKSHEGEKLNISFDGQVDIIADEEIKIEKNEFYAKLLILNRQKDIFYDILKEKLYWSIPPCGKNK